MESNYRGFIIEILPEAGKYIVKAKKTDGSLINHPFNPDNCYDEEDGLAQGQNVIDDFLDNY
jgi:hypothetical protein